MLSTATHAGVACGLHGAHAFVEEREMALQRAVVDVTLACAAFLALLHGRCDARPRLSWAPAAHASVKR